MRNGTSTAAFVEQHLESVKTECFDLDPRPGQYHFHTVDQDWSNEQWRHEDLRLNCSTQFTTEADLTAGQECLGHIVGGYDSTGIPMHLAYYYRQEPDGVMLGYQDGAGTIEVLRSPNGTMTILTDKSTLPIRPLEVPLTSAFRE